MSTLPIRPDLITTDAGREFVASLLESAGFDPATGLSQEEASQIDLPVPNIPGQEAPGEVIDAYIERYGRTGAVTAMREAGWN